MATVQDLGRPGHGHQGISENGAGDRWSTQVANTLVGNPPGAPLLEVTSSSLSVHVDTDVLVCVTGADTEPCVAGRPAPSWDPFVLGAGDSLVVPAPTRGLRTYVAVAGSLTARTVLGSVAPDRMLGAGTYLGQGDEIELTSCLCGWRHPCFAHPLFRLGVVRPSWSTRSVLDVTGGPELAEYDERELVGPWPVSAQSDAVGLRTEGPTPTRSTSSEILSRGVPVGAVEVPPGGGLLILLHGRLVTAGYPVPYVVTTAGIDRLGQARPGDELLLRQVPLEEAVAQGHARRHRLVQLAKRTATALRSSGLDALVRPGHLSDSV
jgi:biotin-dependent carboxylase-like uncharacterized protein